MQLLLGLFSLHLVSGTEGERTGCPVSVLLRTDSDWGRGEAGSSDTMGEPLASGRRKQCSQPQQGSQGRGEGALSRLERRICSLT